MFSLTSSQRCCRRHTTAWVVSHPCSRETRMFSTAHCLAQALEIGGANLTPKVRARPCHMLVPELEPHTQTTRQHSEAPNPKPYICRYATAASARARRPPSSPGAVWRRCSRASWTTHTSCARWRTPRCWCRRRRRRRRWRLPPCPASPAAGAAASPRAVPRQPPRSGRASTAPAISTPGRTTGVRLPRPPPAAPALTTTASCGRRWVLQHG